MSLERPGGGLQAAQTCKSLSIDTVARHAHAAPFARAVFAPCSSCLSGFGGAARCRRPARLARRLQLPSRSQTQPWPPCAWASTSSGDTATTTCHSPCRACCRPPWPPGEGAPVLCVPPQCGLPPLPHAVNWPRRRAAYHTPGVGVPCARVLHPVPRLCCPGSVYSPKLSFWVCPLPQRLTGRPPRPGARPGRHPVDADTDAQRPRRRQQPGERAARG